MFDEAEKEFLDEEINKQLQSNKADKTKVNILEVVDNNFALLKERLYKLREIAEIQQLPIQDKATFEAANNKLNDILGGILTEQD